MHIKTETSAKREDANQSNPRYVEWEDYPEKKKRAHEILISQTFPPPPEFQLGPIPGTNPVI